MEEKREFPSGVPEQASGEISFDKIFRLIRKNIVVLLVTALIFAVAACLWTVFLIPETYVSTIGFTVVSTATDTNVTNPSYLSSNLMYTRSVVQSKVEILRANDYYAIVADRYNQNIDKLIEANPDDAELLQEAKRTPQQIASALSFAIIEETELFRIRVTTHSAGESKMIADAINETANQRLTQMAIPENAVVDESKLTDTVRRYITPEMGVKTGPNLPMNVLLGFILGFAVAFFIVYIINSGDKRVKSASDLEEKYSRIPILGTVASFRNSTKA